MRGLFSQVTAKLDLVPKYVRSRLAVTLDRRAFDDLETFCFFLGYPRSGHSVVGQLVNAHPNAVISHELNVLRFLRPGFSRDQIFSLILERDRWFADRDREWTGYDYEIPGTCQGEYETLEVIGDKNGGATSNWIARDPEKLALLRERVDLPLRAVHVVRNPFDNIATMVRVGDGTLDQATETYFRLVEAVAEVRDRLETDEVRDVHHEELLADTRAEVAQLCSFLGLEDREGHLEACADFVYDEPNRSRHELDWPGAKIDRIEERIQAFDFLAGYRFKD